ncbi:MAG: HNH endonuclease [Cyclobacteriaceae bacterium]
MLAIIDMIDRGLIEENRFQVSPELVGLFKGNWNRLVSTGHTPNFALPFYHLQNEKSQIWNLVKVQGFEKALTVSNSIKSFSALREYVRYGQLADEFFLYLQEKINRDFAKAKILERYFPDNSVGVSYASNYLEDINDQILNDDPVNYRKRIQEIWNKSNEDIEVESFVREGAFKRQIPILYNNTCAVTGLRVDMAINASMIDACHIVDWSVSHDDTVSNGISLCPNLHRAFDRGLLSINDDYRVILSDDFKESESPFNISQFRNQKLILPSEKRYYPAHANLEWHRAKWGFN